VPILLVKGHFGSKSRCWRCGWKRKWSSGSPFEKSAHVLVESPVKQALLSKIQTNISCTLKTFEALCLNDVPVIKIFSAGQK
jgi:hypothetical protein